MRRIWKPAFIVNKTAGLGLGPLVKGQIEKDCKKDKAEFKVYETHSPNTEVKLAERAIKEGYSPIIVIGGDGTVSKVGSALAGTGVPMGVIPTGTGNGLAIELNMPLNPFMFYKALKNAEEIDIDVGIVNSQVFINLFGIGLDADIVNEFSNFKGWERNFMQYIGATLKHFSKSNGFKARTSIPQMPLEREHISIMVANNGRLGGSAVIAPLASMQDGQLDLISIPRMNMPDGLQEMVRLISNSIDKSSAILAFSCKEGVIETEVPLSYEVDGEIMPNLCSRFVFKIQNSGLTVLRNTRKVKK